jgi:Dyp-type peroxidase family
MSRKQSSGQPRLRTITVFAPVPEPALDELTQRLRELRAKPSPFEAMPNTHFARLAVLPRNAVRPQPRPQGMRRSARLLDLVTHLGRAQKADPPSLSYLLFSASYDADPGTRDDTAYIEQLRRQLGASADRIWGLCFGYPGRSDQAEFGAFFRERSLRPAGYLFSASDSEPTVGQIQSALRLRQKVIGLALRTDGGSEADLHEQFLATFGQADAHRSDQPVPGTQLPPLDSAAEPALLDPATGAEQLAAVDRGVLTDPDLIDVQNFVTSGYPRHHASRHLLLRITDPPAARKWLALTAESIPTAGWAEQYVDRIGRRPADDTLPDDTLPDDPGPRASAPDFAVHLAFSYAGLVRLGLPESELAGFASEFRAGMAGREAGLTPGLGTSTWQPPFAAPADRSGDPPTAPVHLLVMFSAADPEALKVRLDARPDLLPGPEHGFQLLDALEGGRIPEDRYGPGGSTGKPGFLEHFGFVDGLSQPRIHGVTAGRRTAELPAGEILLGYGDVDGDTAGAGLPAALAKNGSYLVYRKLEQDVPAFRELTRQLAQRLENKLGRRASGTDPEELAAAKLMGRWRDGTPLTLSATRSDPALAREPFGYQEHDAEGLQCPVGAHVRRANPRDSRPVDPNPKITDGGHPGLEAELARRHRMLRRGIPYGRPLPEPTDSESPDATSANGVRVAVDDPSVDDQKRGLLFIALVGDIRRQFEFVQAHWMSDGNAFRLGTDPDLVAGASPEGIKLTVQGRPPTFIQPTKPLVTCRGGEYFFLPGIAALKRIAN